MPSVSVHVADLTIELTLTFFSTKSHQTYVGYLCNILNHILNIALFSKILRFSTLSHSHSRNNPRKRLLYLIEIRNESYLHQLEDSWHSVTCQSVGKSCSQWCVSHTAMSVGYLVMSDRYLVIFSDVRHTHTQSFGNVSVSHVMSIINDAASLYIKRLNHLCSSLFIQ